MNKNIYLDDPLAKLKKQVWEILGTVPDPEVPVLSVIDLGIIRDIDLTLTDSQKSSAILIYITPTYTGCPAVDVMKMGIRMSLLQEGFAQVTFQEVLSPAWTTDWMSESGKKKLKSYGIAPPKYSKTFSSPDSFQEDEVIQCPLCNSFQTKLISQFGSTACKALYQCNDCKEPFDYFKCH